MKNDDLILATYLSLRKCSFINCFNYSRVPFIGSILGDEDLQILPISGKFLVELG